MLARRVKKVEMRHGELLTIIIKYRWSASAISGMAFFYMGHFPGK